MTSDQPVSPDLPEPTPGSSLPPEPDRTPETGKHSEVSAQPKFTRAGALWSALIMGFLVLIVLLIFIAQNTASAEFAFLGWHWSLPLGVAILGAAVAGGLLTVAAGTARIFQLRRAAKKNLKAALHG
ncbi:LapA family protein [Mycolicibacterium sp. XJ870]